MKSPEQTAYEDAIFEADPAKRTAQIASAETIMYGRQTSLAGDPNAIEVQKALQTAIAGLREAVEGARETLHDCVSSSSLSLQTNKHPRGGLQAVLT
jgi:hypothetical protein